MRTGSLFITLYIFWLLLSGQWDYNDPTQRYLMLAGVVCCAFVVWVTKVLKILDRETHPYQMAIQIALYLPWLFKEIVLANIEVAKRVLHPDCPISPQWFSIQYSLKSPVAVTIYANSITLTPGTVTVDVDEKSKTMLIHSLSKESADDLLTNAMHDEVAKIEVSEL